jgi:hypothetical protein
MYKFLMRVVLPKKKTKGKKKIIRANSNAPLEIHTRKPRHLNWDHREVMHHLSTPSKMSTNNSRQSRPTRLI